MYIAFTFRQYKKRFNPKDFNRIRIESTLTSLVARIFFLVDDENEIDFEDVVQQLKKAIIQNIDSQIYQWSMFKQELLNIKEFK